MVTKEIAQIGRWQIDCDPQATRDAFAQVPIGSPELCGCADCRNFAAARERAYPAEALTIFERLGIDRQKESEIWHTHRDEMGFHHYGGFFHFIGCIRSGSDTKQRQNGHGTFDFETVGTDFEWGLTAWLDL